MPQSVDAARVLQYADMVEHLFQQELARTREYVQVKDGITGASMCSFDLAGPSEMQDISGQRGSQTQWLDVDSTRRWAPKSDFNHPVMLSRGDRLATITDLTSTYVENGVMAANRKLDKIVIDAAYGTANTGETGSSTSTFDTTAPTAPGAGGNQIALSATGLTVAKMREARQHFLTRNVGVDDIRRGVQNAFVWLMSGFQMGELLAETEATSGDFVGQGMYREPLSGQVMPLVDGWIRYYMGFYIVVTDQLPTDSNSDRVNLCWHRRAMGLGIWSGSDNANVDFDGAAVTSSFVVTVDRLPEHNNARGIQVMANMGAVRIQDKGVLAVLCDE